MELRDTGYRCIGIVASLECSDGIKMVSLGCAGRRSPEQYVFMKVPSDNIIYNLYTLC